MTGDPAKLGVPILVCGCGANKGSYELFDLTRGRISGLTASHYLGEAISQLHGTYILSRTGDGLVVVDMHAAHERVLYEKMKAEHTTTGLASQKFFITIVF